MPQLPLSELRVVEIGSGDALGYCGKLFADFGAEIIKVEPSGGDAARKIAPLVDAGDGRRESGYFAGLNTNKRSLTADLNQPAGVEKVRALLASADLLLDARHPADIRTSPLSHEELRRSQPGLAITAITWFGEHGPYRDYAVTDSVCRSLAGLVKLVGPIEGPPVLPRDGQIGVVAGLTAFIPTLAGLYARGGQGARRLAVSAHEAMLQISEFDTALALEAGFTRPRIGINRFGRGFPVGNFATKDGWLGVTVVTPAQWIAFCNMIGLPELGPDPRYSATAERYLHAEELNGIIKPVLMHRTAMQWFEKGIELRLPLAIVPDATCASCWRNRSIASAARSRLCCSATRRSTRRCCRSISRVRGPCPTVARHLRAGMMTSPGPRIGVTQVAPLPRGRSVAAEGTAHHRSHHGLGGTDRDTPDGRPRRRYRQGRVPASIRTGFAAPIREAPTTPSEPTRRPTGFR